MTESIVIRVIALRPSHIPIESSIEYLENNPHAHRYSPTMRRDVERLKDHDVNGGDSRFVF